MLCGNRKDGIDVNSGDIGSVFASSQLIRQTCFRLPICVFQLLLNPEMVKACPTLISYVYDFLENKAYSKGKGEFARKVPLSSQQTTSVTAACLLLSKNASTSFVASPRQIDTFVNPLRSSMRNMSNAVKALPDSLAEGMNKVSDNMGRMSERLGQDIKQSILKVPPLLPKADIGPEHCRVSAQLDDNVSGRSRGFTC